MKESIKPEFFEETLKKYRGSKAQIWKFDISLKRLVLKFSKPDIEKPLFLICAGCEAISGSFSWDNSDIFISQKEDEGGLGLATIIVDETSGFKLICFGGVALVIRDTIGKDFFFS